MSMLDKIILLMACIPDSQLLCAFISIVKHWDTIPKNDLLTQAISPFELLRSFDALAIITIVSLSLVPLVGIYPGPPISEADSHTGHIIRV